MLQDALQKLANELADEQLEQGLTLEYRDEVEVSSTPLREDSMLRDNFNTGPDQEELDEILEAEGEEDLEEDQVIISGQFEDWSTGGPNCSCLCARWEKPVKKCSCHCHWMGTSTSEDIAHLQLHSGRRLMRDVDEAFLIRKHEREGLDRRERARKRLPERREKQRKKRADPDEKRKRSEYLRKRKAKRIEEMMKNSDIKNFEKGRDERST
ncbi:hypothetical protein BT63DRAFT_456843 [Microthyrium microscopicum]|uniref:Uncharacterized protein n=1 Tax=Microthyrium microscopicum TaxID=703497 RepID=A0A6A6U5I6_9PEZI|nr:hypothetical protein BT63DRAFT_456843 [Microthyrium microscopicum]